MNDKIILKKKETPPQYDLQDNESVPKTKITICIRLELGHAFVFLLRSAYICQLPKFNRSMSR